MYYLLQFLCDHIFHVCTDKGIRKSKTITRARYGKLLYEAKVICKNDSLKSQKLLMKIWASAEIQMK
ncbi:hypothetical protein JTB14_005528 [Gonioctena quinquepunctata]|nr:hypothetical protein JTB14_005528 [Gonioctena quinquepunctata]